MWLKVIGNKKTIIIIGLVVISFLAFIITYNNVYNKTVEKEVILEEKDKIKCRNTKIWIAEITNTKGSQLNELVKLHKEYKLDSTTLKIISELSIKFNVTPNKVIEALGVIDLTDPQTTKQRINLTLKKQKDKLYWLETKDANPQAPWIKERKEIINMCELELALLHKAEENKIVNQKLQFVRAQYIHSIYPRVYPWKGTEGGGHH
ncbi:MAG: hypothetical protein AB1567_07235 [bacterium]